MSVSEDFAGAAGALSAPWVQAQSGATTTLNRSGSGTGVASATATDEVVAYYAAGFGADQSMQVKATFINGGTDWVYTVVRASGQDATRTFFGLYNDGAGGAGHAEWFKEVNGVVTVLGNIAATAVNGDIFGMDIVGTTMTYYKNGVSQGTKVDASIASGQPGTGGFGSTMQLDDFLATDLSATAGAPPGVLDRIYNRPMGVNGMTGPWGMVAEALRALGSTVIPSADVVLAVDDLFIALGIEAPSLTQANVLVVNDATIALNIDSPALTQQNTLDVADALIGLAIDSPSLTQANVLAIADALIALSAESPSLTQANVLVVADALIALSAESPALVQANVLAVADALIALAIESPTLELPGILDVADAVIGLTIQSPALTQANVLAVSDSMVALSIEAPDLVQNYLLAVADVLVALTIETPTLTLGLGAEVRVTRIRVNRAHAILRDRSTRPIVWSWLSGPTLRQAA